MQIDQALIFSLSDLESALSRLSVSEPDLVLVFGTLDFVEQPSFFATLSQHVSPTVVAGCSTAGEISSEDAHEKSCVITAVRFEHTPTRVLSAEFPLEADASDAGRAMGKRLREEAPADADLQAILVFARGTAINGSSLIEGFRDSVGDDVIISGGLAGDDGAFKHTITLSALGCRSDALVAVGLYGPNVSVRTGSAGGWQPFGPTRRVTHCEGNVLYTLDGKPALELYKRYLGDYAKDLPASGLLFPFEMLDESAASVGLIRTLLAVNEDDHSLTFAGDLRNDGFVRMMHSSTDQLILGAEEAATISLQEYHALQKGPALALLVSCVGRKLVMGDRVFEEVEIVDEKLTHELETDVTLCGFYSYGEINPHGTLQACQLHNQTMTVAVIQEYAK